MLTFEQIKELIDLVTERGLQGVEIERAGFRVRIEGKRPAEVVQVDGGPPVTGEAAAWENPSEEVPPAELEAADGEATESPETSLPADAHVLNSPIVGTFYAAPSPEADPYVRIGDPVKKGQVLCIVEAMKLMNEIEADVTGELIQVYPRNAQPVEYGEPLFAILPS